MKPILACFEVDSGCPRILENLFKTFLRPILDQILENLRPISNGLQWADIIDRIYRGKVQFSVSTGSQFCRDYTRSISVLIQFKTFLRPLSQKLSNLRPFEGLKFAKIN